MTLEQAVRQFYSITNEEKFIDRQQLKLLSEIPQVFYEECGPSSTGKGILVKFYYYLGTDDDEKSDLDFEEEDWEKIGEVVVLHATE